MLAKEGRKAARAAAAAGLAAASLLACHAPSPQPAGPGAQAAAGAAATAAAPLPPRGVPAYRIDAARSELRLLVYRAGTMAALGHDHVIENHALEGWIAAPPSVTATSFYLRMPVAAFVIDAPSARAAAGPAFAEPVSDAAREGTRRNMDGPALLDVERHPVIAVRSVALRGGEPDLVATVVIDVAGRETTRAIPVSVTRAGGRITANAQFPLRQTELGLTPFSVMLGALRVADEMELRIQIVAVAQ